MVKNSVIPAASQYTFQDFLMRLQRCQTPQHIPHLYLENKDLFVFRPDMLCKAVSALSWEKGCALLAGARYQQAIPLEAMNRSLLQMMKHNRTILGGEGPIDHLKHGKLKDLEYDIGSLPIVSWRAAITVLSEAHQMYGHRTPSALYTSAIKCCAPTRQWEASIAILKARQSVNDIVSPMLLAAARCHATYHCWDTSLKLLRIGEAYTPHRFWLSNNRHADGDEISEEVSPFSLLPNETSEENEATNTPVLSVRDKEYLLYTLAEVMAVTPEKQSMKHPLLLQSIHHLLTVGSRSLADAEFYEAAALASGIKTYSEESVHESSPIIADEYKHGYLMSTTTGSSGGKGHLLRRQQKLLSLCFNNLSWANTLALLTTGGAHDIHSRGSISNTSIPLSDTVASRTSPKFVIPWTPGIVASLIRKLSADDRSDNGVDYERKSLSRNDEVLRNILLKLPPSIRCHPEVVLTLFEHYLALGNQPLMASLMLLGKSKSVLGQYKALNSINYGNHLKGSLAMELMDRGASLTHSWGILGGSGHQIIDKVSNDVLPSSSDISHLLLQLWKVKEFEECVAVMRACLAIDTALKVSSAAVVASLECVIQLDRMMGMRESEESHNSTCSSDQKHITDQIKGDRMTLSDSQGDRNVKPSYSLHWRSCVQFATGSLSTAYTATLHSCWSDHPSDTRVGTRDTKLTELPPRIIVLLVEICCMQGSPAGALEIIKLNPTFQHHPDQREMKALLQCAIYERPVEAAFIIKQVLQRIKPQQEVTTTSSSVKCLNYLSDDTSRKTVALMNLYKLLFPSQ